MQISESWVMPLRRYLDGADSYLIDRLERAVGETVSEFLAYPANFTSKSDIQSVMLTKLNHEFRRIRYPLLECLTQSDSWISPVQSDHPMCSAVSEDKFDIAIISPKQDFVFPTGRHACRAVIQILLWRTTEEIVSAWDKIIALHSYRVAMKKADLSFSGITIIFVHPGSEALLGSFRYRQDGISFPDDGIQLQAVSSEGWQEVECLPERTLYGPV